MNAPNGETPAALTASASVKLTTSTPRLPQVACTVKDCRDCRDDCQGRFDRVECYGGIVHELCDCDDDFYNRLNS